MKWFASLLIMASLAGCASTTPALDSGKALAVAWQSLDAASVAADAAVHAGRLKGANAATVAADLPKASAALTVATQAYRASGSSSYVASEVVIATTTLAEITALLSGVN